MHPARWSLIALSLLCVPAVSFAEESTATGSTLEERLNVLSEGAIPLKNLGMSDKNRTAWTAETNRYDERSAELRSRCHEEIRKANRDTVTAKAGQCLRGDLLLEIGHRRKQREMLPDAKDAIDAWIDAATTVIDGVDAGVFTTVDTLKAAKKNLHVTYRAPMLQAIVEARVSVLASLVASLALEIQNMDDPALLEQVVVCLETAHTHATTTPIVTAVLRSTATTLRTCVDLLTPPGDR